MCVVSDKFYKGGRGFVPYLHLENYLQHLLERVKKERYYILKIRKIEISVPFDEYQSLRYYECILEKVRKKNAYKLRKLGMDIPKEAIIACLRFSYEEHKRIYEYRKGGLINYWSLYLIKKGKQGKFIEKVYSEIQQKYDVSRPPNF